MPPPPALRPALLRRVSGLCLLLTLAAPALAQLSVPCEELLDEAQAHYESLEFEEAAARAQACAARGGLPQATAVRAYRLIALASLRLEAISDAEAAIASLLRFDPTYTPDPIADPPLYVSFVEGQRARMQPPSPLPSPAAPPRSGPAISVGASLGVGSYGGERGVASSGLGEFTSNAGLTAGLSAAADLTPSLSAGIRLQAYHLSSRFHLDFAPPVFLRREDSSPWTYALSAEVVGWFPLEGPARPGASLGFGAAFSRLNDGTEVGVFLQPGLRLDVPLAPAWAMAFALETALVFPSEALDLRATSGVGARAKDTALDLVTSLGVGVRYYVRP